jgi:hypothetical protein
MAYLNLLASVSEEQVKALSENDSALLRPSMILGVSHLVGYWIEVQPLGKLLGEALDGGKKINEKLWHPFRTPHYHDPAGVRLLHRSIAAAWDEALAGPENEMVKGFRFDIERVLKVFTHAAERGECIVSTLNEPADEERASRTKNIFASGPTDAPGIAVGENWGWPWELSLSVGGAVAVGVFGLCYWRYRRSRKRDDQGDQP